VETGLSGCAVLVTGATRGIGRAIALAYAGEGARVAITYATDEETARETIAACALDAERGALFRLDLEDPATITAAVEQTVEAFGRLDVLVANAIRWPVDARAPLADLDHSTWTRALQANLQGTAATVRAALPHLARSSSGRIVLISSGVSRHGIAGATAYSTAKGALDGLVASLKWEAGTAGILVNIVSPGFTETERNLTHFSNEARDSVRSRTPTQKLSTPDDIARAVVFFGSSANGNITGAYLPVAGGID
jgi:NAD(P)-dependent dehydrogenase (short-subunit alcohol dehydrogenase family)